MLRALRSNHSYLRQLHNFLIQSSFQLMFPHLSMFWSVGIPNFQTQKMMVGQNDHVQKISKHQRLGRIAFDSDHEGWWGDALRICFRFLQDNAATSIWILFASSSRQVLRWTQSSEFLLGINPRGRRNFPNHTNGNGFNSKHSQVFTANSWHFLAL